MIDTDKEKEIISRLHERIRNDGVVIGEDVLKVDTFLNHQIDPVFIMQLGQELGQRFAANGVTKILTVEASGIAVAMAAGLALNVPVLFAKKGRPSTLQGQVYVAQVFSFTRQGETDIFVSAHFLSADDVVLIVDDFLAHGEALQGLISLARQAGARIAGAGIVIEKSFQHGGDAPRQEGIRIESLAAIASMRPGEIRFLSEG